MNNNNKSVIRNLDWLSVLLYTLLVGIGWLAIFSTTHKETDSFTLDSFYYKQLVFIGLSIIMIIFILSIEAKFYERFSSIFYLISMLSLAGLFLFGKTINGATAWYSIGSFTLQPAEFAKVATALVFAKQLSNIQTDINRLKDFAGLLLILTIPCALIILQPDPGSVLVYASFIFVMYREGMSPLFLVITFLLSVIFIATLKFGTITTITIITLTGLLFIWQAKRRNKRFKMRYAILFILGSIIISFSTSYVFNSVFKQHHRDRFSLWLRLDNDITKNSQLNKTVGYNTYQSESAIISGGLKGKGFMEGTRTKGEFVPEQHTDYIFTNIGEEWGFLGTTVVVLIFTFLLIRLIFLAERQKSKFSRIYGYSVVAIIFTHFCINIGMVIGLLPTIGIPLPFFSYGGSGLWGFTILIFIFLRLDANRKIDLASLS